MGRRRLGRRGCFWLGHTVLIHASCGRSVLSGFVLGGFVFGCLVFVGASRGSPVLGGFVFGCLVFVGASCGSPVLGSFVLGGLVGGCLVFIYTIGSCLVFGCTIFRSFVGRPCFLGRHHSAAKLSRLGGGCDGGPSLVHGRRSSWLALAARTCWVCMAVAEWCRSWAAVCSAGVARALIPPVPPL